MRFFVEKNIQAVPVSDLFFGPGGGDDEDDEFCF